MTRNFLFALVLLFPVACTPSAPEGPEAPQQVVVVSDEQGVRLQVGGEDFRVNGINWDYFPIGTTYNYSLWNESDEVIIEALDREMTLLASMGVNTIRQYQDQGVTPRWIEYIYDEYGIYTILNHTAARYGVELDGQWIPQTDYSDPRVAELVVGEVTALVEQFKDARGLLMWLIGNENNYGLVWESAETEELPQGEADVYRARWLYRTLGKAVDAIQAADGLRPVAIANGDLQYIDLIQEEIPNLDVFGTNIYRGISFGDAFSRSMEVLGAPIMMTELGADAYNAREQREDQLSQAIFLKAQWKEIYANAAGMGQTGNAIGGLTFQWTDGWWKVNQAANLDVHDTTAGWGNAGYDYDYVAGQGNMNEEWWGVVAKGPTRAPSQFELKPRAAYYTLQQAHGFDPYAAGANLESLDAAFSKIDPARDERLARSGTQSDADSP